MSDYTTTNGCGKCGAHGFELPHECKGDEIEKLREALRVATEALEYYARTEALACLDPEQPILISRIEEDAPPLVAQYIKVHLAYKYLQRSKEALNRIEKIIKEPK